MTRPQERQRDPGETKPQEPSQHPATNRWRTDEGGGEGTKTHPPPEQPRGKGTKTEADGNLRGMNPQELGETVGAARPPEWTPSPTEWGGGEPGLRSGGKPWGGGAPHRGQGI